MLAEAFSRKSVTDSHSLWAEIYGRGRETKTGVTITLDTALRVTTVLACARVIAEGLAQVPYKLMQESADGRSRLPAKAHPLYRVLHSRPNPWMTSFELRELIGLHACLAQQFIAYVGRNLSGQVTEIIPFVPGTVEVKQQPDYSLLYTVTASNGTKRDFEQNQVWHVRGPSWNGIVGMDALRYAGEAIGLAVAAESSQATLHRNGTRVNGMYSVDGTLNGEQHAALRKWIEQNYAGDAAGATMILDRAAKFTPLQMTGIDAQHLETRRFQIEEICRALRVNPIMVGAESKNTTYASAEQMFLAHVVHTLAPWYSRIEQSADMQLLTERDDRDGYYTTFIEAGLLRGSAKDTKDVILGYVNGGILTPNEGRSLLDRNPMDEESDKLRVPANIVGEPKPAETEKTPEGE